MELLILLFLAACLVLPLLLITGYILLKIVVWTIVVLVLAIAFASWLMPFVLFALLIWVIYKVGFAEAKT